MLFVTHQATVLSRHILGSQQLRRQMSAEGLKPARPSEVGMRALCVLCDFPELACVRTSQGSQKKENQ